MARTILVVGVISVTLNFFACSQKKISDDSKESVEIDSSFARYMEDFNNRPVYKVLTRAAIDSTLDDQLLQVVFDNLFEKLPDDYEKEYETVMSWNNSRQAIYLIWLLEAEVNNGGYNQFYFNSSGQFYKHLPGALRLVGANEFAALTDKANSIFDTENEQITKHQDGTIEGFSKSYEDNPLNDLDTEFYKLYHTENLLQIHVDYIRRNVDDFVDQ